MAGVAITRMELSASELRAVGKTAKTPAVVRRILALALVLEGEDRGTAAKTCGMDRQTLRDWVHRYNSDGVAGLANRKGVGRPPKLNAEQKEAFKQLVEKGPDRAEDWFQDEARVGQQGTLTRVWAKRGSRPRAPRDQRYEWAYIFGAVCPERSATAALVLPCANAEAMNLHLAEISKQVAAGA